MCLQKFCSKPLNERHIAFWDCDHNLYLWFCLCVWNTQTISTSVTAHWDSEQTFHLCFSRSAFLIVYQLWSLSNLVLVCCSFANPLAFRKPVIIEIYCLSLCLSMFMDQNQTTHLLPGRQWWRVIECRIFWWGRYRGSAWNSRSGRVRLRIFPFPSVFNLGYCYQFSSPT